MMELLIADGNSESRKKMAQLCIEAGYSVSVAASAAAALGSLLKKEVQVVLLGGEFDELPAIELIPLLKRCQPHVSIILVSGELPLPLLRKARAAGIFYHALRPSGPGDEEEIRQAVRCAFATLKSEPLLRCAEAAHPTIWSRPVHPNQGGSHESESHSERSTDLDVGHGLSGAGRRSRPGRPQRHRGLGVSRFLRADRHCPAGAGGAADDRTDQGGGRTPGRGDGESRRMIWRQACYTLMEVKMTRWIILGGAVLLAAGLSALNAVYPAALQGFSGLVIWFFLGFCGIIVVAQVLAAVGALRALARRQAEASRQPAQQMMEGGKR
ncbi:MAG TPA: response regulator [Desulfuromonadales bacterium]|nr:response regulator [Desulfuromonadales bacterium]